MASHFNPLQYARQLERSGVPTAQAEVHANTLAQVIEECAAQPAQLDGLKREMSFELEALKTHMAMKLAEWRGELSEQMTNLAARLHDAIHRMERRMDRLEERMKRQQRANGVVIALLIGLYAQLYFR